jgi:hypothetical protein
MPNITLQDYLLTPLYLIFFYKVAYLFREKYYPRGHSWRKYFLPGLSAKILGAIIFALIYEYYYKGGDTFEFFRHSRIINTAFDTSAGSWYRLMTHKADGTNLTDAYSLSQMYWYEDVSSYTIARLGAFIGLFCFTKYLIIAITFAVISFTGAWALFVTFASQYKNLHGKIAIATLFMPSLIIGGSGFFKDPICISTVGWITYFFYLFFDKKKISLPAIVFLISCVLLCYYIKSYIVLSLVPLLALRAILVFKKKIFRAGSIAVKILFLFILLFAARYAYRQTRSFIDGLQGEKLASTIKLQKDYLLRISVDEEGSSYDLGDFEPTLGAIASKFLPAVNVTLFRPYLWESKKVLVFFLALESLGILMLTIWLFISVSPLRILKKIYRDPNLILCLGFSIIFAFFVGISSYNFGALSRYKIPCIPFFMLFLFITADKGNGAREQKSSPQPAVS